MPHRYGQIGPPAPGTGGSGRRRLWARGALGLLVVFALAVSGLLGFRLMQGMNELRSAPLDNVQWTLSQAEVDHLRLWNSALEARRARDTETLADDAAALAELRRRFDLFYSRVAMLSQGRMFEALREVPDASDRLKRLGVFLDATSPILAQDDRGLSAQLDLLGQTIEAQFATVRDLSLQGVRIFAVASDQQRQRFERLLMMAFLGAAMLIVLLLGLLAITIRQQRISDRRGQEVARSQARLNLVVSSSLDAILAVNADGRVLEFNGAAQDLFGYAREEAVGRDIAELIVPPHLRESHHAGMERFRRTGEKRVADQGRIEISAMRADGSEFPVELSVRSVETDAELSFVAFVRDITAQRAAAQALEEARDQALAGDKAKSSFVAMMSHEMRTPLNGLIGVLDLLKGTDLGPRQAEYVEIAAASGEILMRHVNDVLDIAQLESSRLELDEAPVDLPAIVQQVFDLNRVDAEAKGLALILENCEVPFPVRADGHRLRQVLMNLVGNAVKFTETGRVLVHLDCAARGADTLDLVITVADTGPGIPPDRREEVFEDFVTLQSSYDRKASGSGLGLAITRRIVAAMGGSVTLEEAPGGGCLFRVALVLHRADPAGKRKAAPVRGGPPRRPLDVLVVEDNEVNRYVARHMLEAAGHRVAVAHDGEEGVRLASARRFDLILMDVSMPGMDGVSATRLIRQMPPPHGSVPIFGLTAHALPEERHRFAEAGMQNCLIKPIRLNVILEALDTLGRDGAPGGAMIDGAEASQEGPIDADILSGIATVLPEGDLRKLLERVVAEIEKTVPLIRSAAEAGDDARVVEMAHRLGGSSAMVGASALHRVLSRIESAAKSDAQTGEATASAMMQSLGHAARQASKVLREFAEAV